MKHIIGWWSGGITSAIACKLTIDLFGKDKVRLIFIDTKNEHDDTYRFLQDCESWYGLPIETLTNENYNDIREVWRKFKSLNVATGAICSSELKRKVRTEWERTNEFEYQVFGFDMDEPHRAKAMAVNYPNIKPIFPLLMFGINKNVASKMVTEAGIELPKPYHEGYRNNNCFKTGCVQGGIGYWQKRKKEYPNETAEMGAIEHELTNLKNKPVTMLRYNEGCERYPLFLYPHPDYPELKCIDDVKGYAVNPICDCNGFCGINDLSPRSETEKEINYDDGMSYQRKLFY